MIIQLLIHHFEQEITLSLIIRLIFILPSVFGVSPSLKNGFGITETLFLCIIFRFLNEFGQLSSF
jgi:hypothetical protein